MINDQTVVESCQAGQELVHAGLGWLGAARITMRLGEIPEGCRIDMIEVPVQGPVGLIPDQLAAVPVS